MERSTFAIIVRSKWAAAKKTIYVEVLRLGIAIENYSWKAFILARKAIKYTKHYRVRDFYVKLICDFKSYHDTMVYLVECGNIKDDPKDREKYEDCKAKIAAIFRAKKRLQAKRKFSSKETLMYLNGYINQERMRDKYQPI